MNVSQWLPKTDRQKLQVFYRGTKSLMFNKKAPDKLHKIKFTRTNRISQEWYRILIYDQYQSTKSFADHDAWFEIK